MILISVHTLCGRAEIYVDDNKIKAFDVALFTGAYKNIVAGLVKPENYCIPYLSRGVAVPGGDTKSYYIELVKITELRCKK